LKENIITNNLQQGIYLLTTGTNYFYDNFVCNNTVRDFRCQNSLGIDYTGHTFTNQLGCDWLVKNSNCLETINIENCQALDRQNTIYKITKDIAFSDSSVAATCFEVSESDITIDGQGHELFSLTGRIGFKARNAFRIEIKNLTIINFSTAISFYKVNNSIIKNLTFARNNKAISSDESGENLIAFNEIKENTGYASVVVQRGVKNKLMQNYVFNNQEEGLHFRGRSRYNEISDNIITDNGEYGIYFTGTSHRNRLFNNLICGNPIDDVRCWESYIGDNSGNIFDNTNCNDLFRADSCPLPE